MHFPEVPAPVLGCSFFRIKASGA